MMPRTGLERGMADELLRDDLQAPGPCLPGVGMGSPFTDLGAQPGLWGLGLGVVSYMCGLEEV